MHNQRQAGDCYVKVAVDVKEKGEQSLVNQARRLVATCSTFL